MQEAMERITASTTMLADEIIRAAKSGTEISSAISKSWNTRLERLRKLTPSNPRLGEAIEALQQLKEDSIGEVKVNSFNIQQTQKRVKEGLEELSTSTVFESFANDIFSLLQNGDREGVLSQIHQARSQHREQLDELENLYKYVVQIMTRKEVLV
jgi:type II secretory pathway component PulF